MVNNAYWYVHALRKKDGHILRRALDFEVEGQEKKDRPKRTWKKQVEEESGKVGFKGKMHLADQSGVLALSDGQ